MIEVAVASGKGGVGKTTVSSTLLLRLWRDKVNVVAVDADSEAPNLHLILRVREWVEEVEFKEGFVARIVKERCIRCGECLKACAFDAIRVVNGEYVINQVVCEGGSTCSLACPTNAIVREQVSRGYIKVGVTEYGFKLVTGLLKPGRPNSGRLVTAIKEKARSVASEDSILIVDSAAGIGCKVIASLAGANLVVLATEPTPAGFSDLTRIYRVARHFMLPAALVINKYDLSEKMTRRITDFASQNKIYLLGEVPYDDSVPKAVSQRKPVVEAYPSSRASKALEEIAARFKREIIDSIEDWVSKYKPRRPEPYKPQIM